MAISVAAYARFLAVQDEDAATEAVSALTLTLSDLTDDARTIELGVSLQELDEIAELRKIVDETTEAQPVLYSTA